MERPRCFGTYEYSELSIICKRCEYYKVCGLIKPKKPKPKYTNDKYFEMVKRI